MQDYNDKVISSESEVNNDFEELETLNNLWKDIK